MTLRPGVTLIELIVALVVLATIVTMVGLRLPSPVGDRVDSPTTRLYEARGEALRSGRAVHFSLDDTLNRSAVAMPDGSVVADTAAHVRRLTGAVPPGLRRLP